MRHFPGGTAGFGDYGIKSYATNANKQARAMRQIEIR